MFKKITFIFFVSVFMFSCGTSTKVVGSPKGSTSKPTQKTSSPTTQTQEPTIADKIIWTAFKYRGVPYKYGGTTSQGMDCSGLIMVSFQERGLSLPRSSYDMSQRGYKIPLQQAKRGDLLFFRTNPRKPNRVTHVGLVSHSENGVIKFIHASSKRGVTLNTMNQNYYKKHFAFAKRVLD